MEVKFRAKHPLESMNQMQEAKRKKTLSFDRGTSIHYVGKAKWANERLLTLNFNCIGNHLAHVQIL